MDKIELTTQDVERLLEWRDNHKEEVLRAPAPLKAVEIDIKENGFRLKCIREGDTLRLYISQNFEQLGNCTLVRTGVGLWSMAKDRVKIKESQRNEIVESVLTVYSSLMALMAYGRIVPDEEKSVGNAGEKPRKGRSGKPAKPQKSTKRITYILRNANGELSVAPQGSHASPKGIFSVRGHYRHYKSGKVVWVSEYKKGTGKKKSKTYKLRKNGKEL